MSLTIQDYAMIGPVKCILPGGANCQITAVSFINKCIYVDGVVKTNLEGIKPILRPLSSLTEAEARELYELIHFDSKCEESGDYLNLFWRDEPYWIPGTTETLCMGNPKAWRWLLAHHFDLLGWIESGDAIDATKINQ